MARREWYGIYYLRACMSLMVVAWHMRLFGSSSLFDPNGYSTHRIELSDIINFNLLLLAVPVFFLISIFLQVEKHDHNLFDIKGRLERLAYLYVFWMGIYLMICHLDGRLQTIWPDSIPTTIKFIVSGGNSLFYFLFSLIFLTIVCHLTVRLHLKWKILLTIFFAVLLWSFAEISEKLNQCSILTALWNPINFIVYVFISEIIYCCIGHNPYVAFTAAYRKAIVFLSILFFLCAVCEWNWFQGFNNFANNGYAFPSYTRLSTAVGSTVLFLLFSLIKRPPGIFVRYLSDYSLGLYCLHGFVGYYYLQFKQGDHYSANRIIDFVLIVSISLILSIFLRRAFQKGLI